VSETPRTENIVPGMAFERPIEEIEAQIAELESLSLSTRLDISSEIEALKNRLRETIHKTYSDLSAWERVNVARHPKRPVTADYIQEILDDFVELHGDRAFGDDRAIVTGLATMEDWRFMLVAHRKGRTTKERMECNFGCAHPEGYRKALRKMRLAEKLDLPIVCLINTPGAYPGIGAEERGQALAIAENILGMMTLKVPIVALVIGEGGSGGALGIGVGGGGGGLGGGGGGGRAWNRRRGPRADARACLLLGDQPRGLRRDPLEGRRALARGRGGPALDLERPDWAGRRR
jgi:acetyl-CoA carboxylase carboxyl transferase subunit alpha